MDDETISWLECQEEGEKMVGNPNYLQGTSPTPRVGNPPPPTSLYLLKVLHSPRVSWPQS